MRKEIEKIKDNKKWTIKKDKIQLKEIKYAYIVFDEKSKAKAV